MAVQTASYTNLLTFEDFAFATPYYETGGNPPEIIDDKGNKYDWAETYPDDNDANIVSYWRSKTLDFTEQFPQYAHMWKTVDKVVLQYVDKSANIATTIYLSNDGGVSWTTSTRLIGNGDGKPKTADFFFRNQENCTGQDFVIKIESTSADKKFIWTGFIIEFYPRGYYFEI